VKPPPPKRIGREFAEYRAAGGHIKIEPVKALQISGDQVRRREQIVQPLGALHPRTLEIIGLQLLVDELPVA